MAKRAKKSTTKTEPTAAKPRSLPGPRVVRTEEEAPPTPAVDDSGISLEDIGQAYAALLSQGDTPYDGETPSPQEAIVAAAPVSEESFLEPSEPADDDSCELSPRSILEAILFVGHPQNEPITAEKVASLMRGVRPEEIDDLVRELNEQYEAEQCPYAIASEGAGYRLTLREEFADLRERFYGKVKEARLSQTAIDTLAVVAYRQPVSHKQVDEFRGKPSGALLNQLVRRQLVRIERPPESPKEVHYRTTNRFLDLFGLASLDDLPRSQD